MALQPFSGPRSLLPSGSLRPFSRTSMATSEASAASFVSRLKLTAIRKLRAPTTEAPLRAARSSQAPQKSGRRAEFAIFSRRDSYSPARQTARLRRSGEKAAAS